MSEELAHGMLWRSRAVLSLPEKWLRNLIDHHGESELANVAEGDTVFGAGQYGDPRSGNENENGEAKDCLLERFARVSRGQPGRRQQDVEASTETTGSCPLRIVILP